jgi:hypothetical protein
MYFEVPKAACTQMKELLRTLEGAPPLKLLAGGLRETRRDMFVHARENIPLPSLVDLDDKTQREVLESNDFLRMTFVRNPYTRLVSAWKNKVAPCEPAYEGLYLQIKHRLPEVHSKLLITFDEFVEYLANQSDLRTWNTHWRRQVDHLFLEALDFSHVGKIEKMGEGLLLFQRHLGLAEPLLAAGKNVSAPIGLATYNESLADRVYFLYQADFEKLGYDRNSWRDGQQSLGQVSRNSVVSEERFYDEIIERNLIISSLYRERDWLQAELQWVSRLHLLDVANALLKLRWAWLKFASNLKARVQTMFR